jgi:hypothetical protein
LKALIKIQLGYKNIIYMILIYQRRHALIRNALIHSPYHRKVNNRHAKLT